VRTFAAWSLWFLGDLEELARRLPAHLHEAEERGDRYFATNLRSAFTNSAWLVQGNVAEARRLAEESIGAWSREGFHLQHFYDMVARTHVDLYLGDGERAYQALEERWGALDRSLTLRIQLVRVFMEHLRAHAAIAAVAASPSRARRLLPIARNAARRIEGESMPWADPLAAAIRAALARQEGDVRDAERHLGAAIGGFDAAGMSLFAAAARRHRGRLLGGDAGRDAVISADSWMRARGVAEPARIAAMLLGGLDAD
jgi:ATP/maltotriose-dependent transcriptional regulator MalT